ncbi:MAG: Polyketide cyclase / dehydrase and lipid transport, partial [Microbacterium sp.]|nr:Polyketide cyclase / dehydrase and lipid transport [Microbacterium sp.]
MVHIKTSIVIRRPQEETFDYLTDLRNAKEWATEFVDVAYDGELRVGATGVDTRRRGSKEFRLPWTVTEHRRPERLVLEFGPPVPATAEFTFRPEPGGTRFTC